MFEARRWCGGVFLDDFLADHSNAQYFFADYFDSCFFGYLSTQYSVI
jgi:hypothetical protein